MIRCLIVLFISLLSTPSLAFNWRDLWFTPDQQGQSLMEKAQFAKAKETFERTDWAAAAAYKAGDYQRAAELFKNLKTEQGNYNWGNALAHLGQYEQAIEAYDKALASNPNNQDAIYNRQLVKDLMKKDKESKQNKDEEKKDQNKNKDKKDQNKDQENKDQESKDQQNKDQENKDQQNKDQQNKDQQNKDQQNKDQQNKDQQNKDQQNKDQQNKDQENKDQQNKDQENQDQQNKDQANKDKNQKNQQEQKQDKSKDQQGETQSEADLEKQQEKEQWLRLIPDDPGGLMREKFLRDHLRRERGWYQ